MNNENIVIVGGGITGLAAAYIASKSNKNITIIESSEKVGGLLNTFKTDEDRLEFYYHHFFTHDKEINWIFEDLGITDKVVFHKTSMGVFRNGKMYDFNSPKDLLTFKPITFIDKMLFGFSTIFLGKFADWKKYESVPALKWLNKWAGKSTTASIWKPLLNIKFGPHADKIPLAWMVGRMKQRMNSRKKGEEHLGYLDGSLQVLLDTILEKLKAVNITIKTGYKPEELIIENNKVTGIKVNGEVVKADKILFTTPSHSVAEILKPHHKEIADEINKVKYFGAVCTILELDRKFSDIYWTNIADDGYPFGGIIEHTNFISKEKYGNKNIVYLSRYFDLEEDIAAMDNEQIKQLMIPPLKKINSEFDESWIQKTHVFKTSTAATICDLNFSKKIVDSKLPIDGLYLANMMHIYPDERSVNNSIRIAAEACNAMGVDSSFVPKANSLSGQIGF